MEVRLSSPRAIASSRVAATEYPSRSVTVTGLSRTGVAMRVVDVGEGRPFVFLHGLVGLNDHWEDSVRHMSQRVRCVMLEVPLLELRDEDCSIDGVAALTERFLDGYFAGGMQRPVLVGNSFGGHVALRMALDRPDAVGGLVLAGAAGLIERSMVSDIQIRPSREWLTRKIGELFYDPSRHLRDSEVDRAFAALSDRGGARAMVKLSRSARKNHLGDRVQEIGAPTLLIWGRNDVVTPPEAAAQFLNRLPDARIVWFDECGHTPMIEKPEEFGAAVVAFADELDRRHGGR